MPSRPSAPQAAAAHGGLTLPKLYAIVDVEVCARAGQPPIDVVRAFLSAGVRLIQLRAKTWDSGPFLDLACAAVAEAKVASAKVVVNDRADIARLAGAQGLHVGQDDLTPAEARSIVSAGSLIGLSTHTETQWRAALDAPIDYVAIGPVFGTETKVTGYHAVGVETIGRVVEAARAKELPVVAIGGITVETAPALIAAGAAAVAVIGDLLAGAPEARARAFMRALA